MRHLGPAFAVLTLAGSTLAGSARAEIAAVWAVDDGTKVAPSAIEHPLARGNGSFEADPPRVKLFGLRNETVAFQIILVGGASDTTEVSVALDAVGTIKNRRVEADPDRYWLGRRIEIFDERYLEVRERSHDMVWEPGSAAEPTISGFVPDPLEPHRGTLGVPAGSAQGVWIDVYIPKDTPRGSHRGTVRIDVGGAPCELPACRLPIELEVLDVAMPDVPSTRTMVWFSGADEDREYMASRYFDAPATVSRRDMAALRRRHLWLARRHRVSLFASDDAFADGAPGQELHDQLDGKAFATEAGYDGPGVSAPLDVYAIHAYGGSLTPEEARTWSDWFTAVAPAAEYFLYVVDEPHDEALFPGINEIARRAAPVPAFVTHRPTEALACDIFCALPADYSVATARAVKQRVWTYNGVRPFSGTFATDDVAISPRVNPWIQHKYGIARWFYWEATYYRDVQGGRSHVDVWREAQNFGTRFGDRINGDGLLMYPGRDRRFPAEDRGVDRPLPSLRLKAWRRGIEDVEYLRLVEKAGHAAFAAELMAALVPRALADETEAGEPVSWPEEGEPWLAARRALFDTLAAGTPPAIDVAALARAPEPWWPRSERRLLRLARPLTSSPRRMIATGAALCLAIAAFVWRYRRRSCQRERAAEQ